MGKLNFFEKNDALQLLREEEHFDADCATLGKLNPASKLQNEIANVNQFNKSSLHGRILFELLDMTTIEEIMAARKLPQSNDDGQPIEGELTNEEQPTKEELPEKEQTADEEEPLTQVAVKSDSGKKKSKSKKSSRG